MKIVRRNKPTENAPGARLARHVVHKPARMLAWLNGIRRRFSPSVRLLVRGATVNVRGTRDDLYATIGRVVDKLANGLLSRKRRQHSGPHLRDENPLRTFAAA